MNKLAITIQARMKSTRLPGKVLEKICKEDNALDLMIDRIRSTKIPFGCDIWVLTTENEADELIERWCKKNDVRCFRGNERNVSNRMFDFINCYGYKNIVDLTGDCPLICPEMLRRMIRTYFHRGYSYLSNTMKRTFPDGFDIQIYSSELYIHTLFHCRDRIIEGHTGWNITKNMKSILLEDSGYKFGNVTAAKKYNRPEIGLTLDEEDDLKVIKQIFAHLEGTGNIFANHKTIIDYVLEHDLHKINEKVKRKTPGEG